jgi:hypothetical protein
MQKFSLDNTTTIGKIRVRLTDRIYVEYDESNNITNIHGESLGFVIKIIPGKSIDNTESSSKANITVNYAVTRTAEYLVGTPDMLTVMQLFKIIRYSNWEWKKQYNDNISFFTRGFNSYSSLLRTFILLLRTPALILVIPELKNDSIIKSTSTILKIHDYNGTNLCDIFNKPKGFIKAIKNKISVLKTYQITEAVKLSETYNWSLENCFKIIELFNSTDFSTTYRGGGYVVPVKIFILNRLAVSYSFEKIYNYFNKNFNKGYVEKEYRLAGLIIDSWRMLEHLKVLQPTDSAPIINLDRAHQFHTVVLKSYNTLTYRKDTSASFNKYVGEASEYMDLELDGYTFSVIKSKTDLNREGYEQGHCVASYYDYIESGRCVIVSMRKTDNLEKPVLTIEAKKSGKSVKTYQISGKSNRSATTDERKVINKWVKEASSRLELNKSVKTENVSKDKEKAKITLINLLNKTKK